MRYESLDIEIPEARRRWEALGSPVLPALVIGDQTHSVLHFSQVGSLLGIRVAPTQEALRLGWDLHTILEAWQELIGQLPWDVLQQSTPSRGRLVIYLAVHAFFRVQFVAPILDDDDHVFRWDPTQTRAREADIVARVGTVDDLLQFMDGTRQDWQTFLLGREDAIQRSQNMTVRTISKGHVPYRTVIETMRNHAAQHYRQVILHLERSGRSPATTFKLEHIRDLRLPEQEY